MYKNAEKDTVIRDFSQSVLNHEKVTLRRKSIFSS